MNNLYCNYSPKKEMAATARCGSGLSLLCCTTPHPYCTVYLSPICTVICTVLNISPLRLAGKNCAISRITDILPHVIHVDNPFLTRFGFSSGRSHTLYRRVMNFPASNIYRLSRLLLLSRAVKGANHVILCSNAASHPAQYSTVTVFSGGCASAHNLSPKAKASHPPYILRTFPSIPTIVQLTSLLSRDTQRRSLDPIDTPLEHIQMLLQRRRQEPSPNCPDAPEILS
jgi:hypothetical protein